jgi:electron transport complex protein RnfG
VFASAADFAVEELTGDTQAADSVDIDGLYQALDESGSILGYVLEITSHEGYNGDIQFAMGIANDGTVNGISLLSISETPGLGMRAEEVLKPQFSDKKVTHFEYTKVGAVTDDQIDAISGATITTNAVTNAVNAGLDYFYTNLAEGRDGQ